MMNIWNKIKTWCSDTWDWFMSFFSSKKIEVTEKVNHNLDNLEEKKEEIKEIIEEKLESEEERITKLLNRKMVRALEMIDEATEDLDGKIDVYRRSKMKHLIAKYKNEPEQIDRIMMRELGKTVDVSEEE